MAMDIKHENFDYIIYHRNCPDGFTGLITYILCKKYTDSSQMPYIYGDQPDATHLPPHIKNKRVLIIDVAYKRNLLEKIINEAEYVTHIDHHVTVRPDTIELGKTYNNKFVSIYDIEESGASLTWMCMKGDKKMPKFIKYVKDNDMGIWKYKNTMPFITALRIHYLFEHVYDNIMKWGLLFEIKEVKRLIKKGKIYVNYEDYLLNQNYKKYTLEKFPSEKIYNNNKQHFSMPGQYTVALVNSSGCPSGTQLGKKILDEIECDFCILWTLHMDKKKYVLSFRSKKIDVGKIAQLFGGGGHKLASACSIYASQYNITDMFFPVSMGRFQS